MRVFEADESVRNELNQFYCEQGYHSGWGSSERAFIATNNGEIIGSVKIEVNNGFSVLRGMYIAKDYQGDGVGTEFLKHIEPILNKTTSYCMPFSHLGKFYEQIGFQAVSPDSFPEYLAKRYHGYENKGYRIIAMRREQTV